MTGVRITGTGSYLPDRVVTSAQLEADLGLEAGWIEQRTGIRERRFAAPEQATSDLAIEAAQAAVADAGLTPEELDLVVVATSTPDWPQPATAAAVHGGIGMRADAGSVDVDAVCSGFVYALAMALGLITSGSGPQNALVVGADTYSRITDPTDRRTRVLFGDGAGAVVVQTTGAQSDWRFRAGTDFSGHEALIVPAGGSREPLTAAAIEAGRAWFSMDGRAVREYAVPTLAQGIAAVRTSSDAHVIPHQSNLRMLEAAMAQADVPDERWHSTLDFAGNTAAASIPITLDHARRRGDLSTAQELVLVGYGGGLSWAALSLTLSGEL